MQRLISERLELRPIDIGDREAIFAYRSLPEVSRYQAWKPATSQEVAEFIGRIVREPDIPGSWLQLAIIQKGTNELIGDLGVHFLPDEPEHVEIGITLRPQSQGRGYAAEALTTIFDYLFRRLKKHRIVASVDPENLASLRLMERMKMRKEAHFRKSVFLGGRWADDMVYAILAEEWSKSLIANAEPGGWPVIPESDGEETNENQDSGNNR